MEILQVKNCTVIEISLNGWTPQQNRGAGQKNQVDYLEDSTTEMTQSEQQIEEHWKKWKRDSGA